MKRRNQVVVAILRFVVERHPLLDDLGQGRGIERLAGGRDGGEDILDEIDEIAPIAVGKPDERLARTLLEGQRPRLMTLGAGDQGRERAMIERFSTSTWGAERSAPLSSNDGFSVVAPTSVIVPSSMTAGSCPAANG